jgi:transcription initiation factor TFIID TATA-box-binding protein
MVITGCKNTRDIDAAVGKVIRILRCIGFDAKHGEFIVQNMTATTDVGVPIRLEELYCKYSKRATYEPEVFPGLVFRTPGTRVVQLVFVNGKIVITGAKSQEAALTAVKDIQLIVKDFYKVAVVPSVPRV